MICISCQWRSADLKKQTVSKMASIIETALASYIQPHKNIRYAHIAFVTFGMATVKKGFKLQVLA